MRSFIEYIQIKEAKLSYGTDVEAEVRADVEDVFNQFARFAQRPVTKMGKGNWANFNYGHWTEERNKGVLIDYITNHILDYVRDMQAEGDVPKSDMKKWAYHLIQNAWQKGPVSRRMAQYMIDQGITYDRYMRGQLGLEEPIKGRPQGRQMGYRKALGAVDPRFASGGKKRIRKELEDVERRFPPDLGKIELE